MNVTIWVWIATIAGLVGLFGVDLFIVDRHPHPIRLAEAARWVTFSVCVAVLFGLGTGLVSGPRYAGEFFAGYLTEYSLSVDNLFVFMLLLSAFAVPALHQHRALLVGVLAALALRGAFIAAGAAAVARFDWIFYGFGALLVYTGWRLVGSPQPAGAYRENRVLRLACRLLPVTNGYYGARTSVKIAGRRYVTPMLIVMIAIGTTDVLFALDSIPAIFGLTKEPYLVFTANAFALLGLRQLYFLLGGLLNRLGYLHIGLAVVVGFIGVKLVLEALAGNGVQWSPQIGTVPSLAVIVVVLGVTVAASLAKARRDPSGANPTPGPVLVAARGAGRSGSGASRPVAAGSRRG